LIPASISPVLQAMLLSRVRALVHQVLEYCRVLALAHRGRALRLEIAAGLWIARGGADHLRMLNIDSGLAAN
jgi:hypothetical protein